MRCGEILLSAVLRILNFARRTHRQTCDIFMLCASWLVSDACPLPANNLGLAHREKRQPFVVYLGLYKLSATIDVGCILPDSFMSICHLRLPANSRSVRNGVPFYALTQGHRAESMPDTLRLMARALATDTRRKMAKPVSAAGSTPPSRRAGNISPIIPI